MLWTEMVTGNAYQYPLEPQMMGHIVREMYHNRTSDPEIGLFGMIEHQRPETAKAQTGVPSVYGSPQLVLRSWTINYIVYL